MKPTFLLLLAACGSGLIGLAQDVNYIRTRTISKPGLTTKSSTDALTSSVDAQQATQYFDGLGRSIQTVTRQQSPHGYDMVIPQVYDAFGREAQHYLPYVSTASDGNYRVNGLTEQNSFNRGFYSGESHFYNQTNFEASPLNRPQVLYQPGSSWVGAARGATTDYLINTLADNVQIWNVDLAAGSLPISSGAYGDGLLFKTVTTDEQLHQVIEYKDKTGHIVLRKVQSLDNPGVDYTGWLCTYYVYDDLDNLRYVIPPKAVEQLFGASWVMSQGVADELCFRYEYDGRKRMIVKKIPGAGEVGLVYDGADRPVFSQDGNQRPNGQWLVTQYDPLDRAIITGLMGYPVSRDVLQQTVSSQTTVVDGSGVQSDPILSSPNTTGDYQASHSITLQEPFSTGATFSGTILNTGISNSASNGLTVGNNAVPPGVAVQPLEINYYDNYDWVAGTGSGLGTTLATDHTTDVNYFITTYNTSPVYAVPVTAYAVASGKLTGSMQLVLEENRPLYTVNFYDDRARLIQSRSTNYTGGTDTVINQYNFSGKVVRSLVTQYKAGHTAQYHKVLTKIDYDAYSRVTAITKNIDGAPADQPISTMQYDELGRLNTKNLGNSLESIVNDYNLRGWITGINKAYLQPGASGHYFGMELGYDKTAGSVLTTSYVHPNLAGNIAGTVWKSAGDGVDRQYDFSYDDANRLVGADFKQQWMGGWGKSDPGGSGAAMDYSVSGLSYDANGNIMHMQQNGFKIGAPTNPIDILAYSYQSNSNKLLQVSDGVNDPNSKLGDFHVSGAIQPTGYGYDNNGNLNLDNNKAIDKINYNFLNLPELVHLNGKGNVQYTYDAIGTKLKKMTIDSLSGLATTTLYMGGMQYQRKAPMSNADGGEDTLLFAGHEEGRARWALHKNGVYGWEYDFYEKDHLGNTRVLLTQELDTAQYVATLEAAYRNTEKALFYGLDTSVVSRAGVGYPDDQSLTSPNDSVTVLNGSGIKQGPSIILKVMSGDTLDLSVRYYYTTASGTTNGSLSATDLLGGLAGGLFAITSGTHGALTDLSNPTTSPLVGALNGFFNDPSIPAVSGRPRAYLNWVLLDNQLRYVGGNNQSGALQVGDAGMDNGQLRLPLTMMKLPITKSGYLYIYLSNVTEHQDVYFDNLRITHYSGPMVEENHYYPFGLAMAGISDKALKGNYAPGKYRYNGKELQSQEFSDGSGLETYDFGARMYDPQIGRWQGVDKFADIYSALTPYQYGANNPVKVIDEAGHLLKDKDGNILATSNGMSTPIERHVTINGKSQWIKIDVEDVTIYTDKGTPVHALRAIKAYVADDGEPGKAGEYTEEVMHKNYRSNCHGYALADGALWIGTENSQASLRTILGDEYDEVTKGGPISIIQWTEAKDGEVVMVHTAMPNGDGTYDQKDDITPADAHASESDFDQDGKRLDTHDGQRKIDLLSFKHKPGGNKTSPLTSYKHAASKGIRITDPQEIKNILKLLGIEAQ